MPGMASWRNDGTVGMQFETVSPCARMSATLASSSSGSFISQSPIASKPAAAYLSTSSANDSFSVEIVESERLTALASWKLCKDTARERGLCQLLRDEVARARAEPWAWMRARAHVPQPLDGRAVTRRRGQGP